MLKKYLNKENIVSKLPYFIISIALLAVDLFTKYLVIENIPIGKSVPVLKPLLYFNHIKNPGVAFGLLRSVKGEYPIIMSIVLFIVALILIAIIISMILSTRGQNKVSLASFTLILGGAFGNVYDRIDADKVVTDFLDMGINASIRFPWVYNMADAFITVGIALAFVAFFVFQEDSSAFEAKPFEEGENNQSAEGEIGNNENKSYT